MVDTAAKITHLAMRASQYLAAFLENGMAKSRNYGGFCGILQLAGAGESGLGQGWVVARAGEQFSDLESG
jgi:hypothetical protein